VTGRGLAIGAVCRTSNSGGGGVVTVGRVGSVVAIGLGAGSGAGGAGARSAGHAATSTATPTIVAASATLPQRTRASMSL